MSPLVKIRFENSDVRDGYVNVRVWAGGAGERLKNCGLLVFFEDEWLAFQSLLRSDTSAAIEFEQTGLEKATRQLTLDLNLPETDQQVFKIRPEEDP